MKEIVYQEVVITCEACGTVKRMPIHDYDECLKHFHGFQCPNGCGHNLCSFMTIGKVQKKKSE